jgi:lambda family phage portal protein
MHVLDRLISHVAPTVALRRAQARLALRRMESGGRMGGYEGASKGRRTDRWHAKPSDANAANGPDLALLRHRSRDLARNNPWARRAIDVLEDWVVGPGITGQPVGRTRAGITTRDAWRAWADSTDCDVDGDTDFAGVQGLVFRTVAESGSALVRRRIRRDSDGLAIPLQLQVLEPDHLDVWTRTYGRNIVHHGIEYDAIGRRVAFWLYPEHPGTDRPEQVTLTSVRVPASEIIHVFRQDRPGQILGVPWLAPALMRLKNLDEFEDAALLRAVTASSFALFVTRAADPDIEDGDPDHEVENLEPGTVEYLNPGETIESPNLPDFGGVDSFAMAQLRAAASSLGMPYELLSGDLSRVNFSSGRLGFNSFERSVAKWQSRLMRRQLLDRVAQWWTEAAIGSAAVPAAAASLRWEWTPPARAILDPGAENQADSDAVRSGLKTLSEVLRARGKDPRTHLEELAEDLDALDELKLPLDCSPRHVVKAGAAPTASDEPEADEPDDEADEVNEPEADKAAA